MASNRILYPLNNMGYVQLLRGQRSEAIALFNEAIRIAAAARDAQGLVPAYIGLANALDRRRPAAAAEAAERRSRRTTPMWMPHAYLAAGKVALHSGDRGGAAEWAAKATALAQQRQDRPALAEALLLSANLGTADSATLAQQAGRLWHDLGNPIGEARADSPSPGRRPAGAATSSSPPPSGCSRTPARGAPSPRPARARRGA